MILLNKFDLSMKFTNYYTHFGFIDLWNKSNYWFFIPLSAMNHKPNSTIEQFIKWQKMQDILIIIICKYAFSLLIFQQYKNENNKIAFKFLFWYDF